MLGLGIGSGSGRLERGGGGLQNRGTMVGYLHVMNIGKVGLGARSG